MEAAIAAKREFANRPRFTLLSTDEPQPTATEPDPVAVLSAFAGPPSGAADCTVETQANMGGSVLDLLRAWDMLRPGDDGDGAEWA
jgi:hypothetical protein